MPEPMPIWIANLALGLIALYVAVVTAMYLVQTWLLFPTRSLESREFSFRRQRSIWR